MHLDVVSVELRLGVMQVLCTGSSNISSAMQQHMSGGFVTLWLDVFVIYDYGYGFNIGALGDGRGWSKRADLAY